MHPKYKNVIIEKKQFLLSDNRRFISDKKLQKNPIKKYINIYSREAHHISITPSIIKEDNINQFHEDDYFTVNSIIPILFNPDNNNDFIICPLWDVWRRNHWLDDYDQDIIEKEKIYKQRTISKSKLFKNILTKYTIISIIALIILISCILNIKIFILLATIEFWFLSMRFIRIYFHIKRNHDFYEYSVATTGTITTCSKITEGYGKYKKRYWIYLYKFKTKEGIPYQGQMKISPLSDIRPYEKNSHATILYDPYCIAQNCLAFYYPYSWIQPEETKKLYQIETIQPDIEESTSK